MSQKLLISDANVLIDIIAGGILDEMFELDYEFGVPDVLFHEELRDRNPDLPKKGLKVLELKEHAIVDTVQISAKHAKAGVSNNDYMALALGRQEDCPIRKSRKSRSTHSPFPRPNDIGMFHYLGGYMQLPRVCNMSK